MKLQTLLLGSALLGASVAHAQDTREFNVVGTLSTVAIYHDYEVPFWTKTLPEASGGKLTAKINAFDLLGLPGGAVYEAVENGVYDVGATIIDYVGGDDPRFEGLDVPGISDPAMSKAVADAYRPHLQTAFQETFDSELLLVAPFTPQVLFCKGEIKGIKDLAGKRVRGSGRFTMDLIEALGGTGVQVAFNEVPVALDRGVIDCGITGILSGYSAGWSEVATHLVALPMGGLDSLGYVINNDTWESLDEASQTLLKTEAAKLETTMWADLATNTAKGIACNTGGECAAGKPYNLTLVEITPEDEKLVLDTIGSAVLPKWAERCGADCVANWEATAGKALGVSLQK